MPDLFGNEQPAIVQGDMALKEIYAAIKSEHRAFERVARGTVESMQMMGRLLIDLKKTVGHGLFEAAVKRNCPFDARSARRYMAAVKKTSKTDTMSVLEDRLLCVLGDPGDEEVDGGEGVTKEGNGGSSSKGTGSGGKTPGGKGKSKKGSKTKATPPVSPDAGGGAEAKPTPFPIRAFERRLADLDLELANHMAAHGEANTPHYHGWRRRMAETGLQARKINTNIKRSGNVPVPQENPLEAILGDLVRLEESLMAYGATRTGNAFVSAKDRHGNPFAAVVAERPSMGELDSHPLRTVMIPWILDLLAFFKPGEAA